MGTSLSDLINQIRIARPLGTVYLGTYRASADFVVPEGGAFIYGFLGAAGRDFTVIQSRYETTNGLRVPKEIIYLCMGLGESIQSAANYFYQIAMQVHAICQISANAGSSIVHETMFTEFPIMPRPRLFRRIAFQDTRAYSRGGRILHKIPTLALAGKIWGHAERRRLLLAIAHYQEALRNWRSGAAPLVAMYLWMAVEALTDAMLRRELSSRGLTEDDLMLEYGIARQMISCPSCGGDVPLPDRRRTKLLAEIRRRLIFQGDDETYRIVSETSNRIEHGYGTFQEIWDVAFTAYAATARYVRIAIFDLVGLEAQHRALIGAQPYNDVYQAPNPPMSILRSVQAPTDWLALDYSPAPTSCKVATNGHEMTIGYD
jgi:hypothetical protein